MLLINFLIYRKGKLIIGIC